ncbi:exported hypothetical protein [Candidatus Zixiibacteriota bacterium]|nr:exported hypothetical protein [candidate division Zixibacteria bacterium]
MKALTALLFLLTAAVAKGNGAEEKEKVYELPDTVTVTAERFPTPINRSAWPARTINAAKLEENISIGEALDGVAGADPAGYGAVGHLSNLFLWGAPSSQILLLYNGRPVYDYGTGGFNLANYDPSELSRIEIVKGTQSSLYGSDAIGGVINLIPRFEYLDKVSGGIGYGSDKLINYHALGAKKFGTAHFNLSVIGLSTDNARANSGARQNNISLKSTILPKSGKLTGSLEYRYFQDSLGVPGAVPNPNNIPYYGNSESQSLVNHQRDFNHSVDLRLLFNEAGTGSWSGEIDGFYERNDLRYFGRYAYLGWNDSSDVMENDKTIGRNSGATGRLKYSGKKFELAGGMEYLSGSSHYKSEMATTTDFYGAQPTESIESTADWKHSRDVAALWGGGSVFLNGMTALDLGGREEVVNGGKGYGSFNTAIRFTPANKLQLKFAYGQAYRLPAFNDLYWPKDEFSEGNPHLIPERGENLLAAAVILPSDAIRFNTDIFWRQVHDLISWAPQGSISGYGSPRWTPSNLNKFRTLGIDFGFKWKINNNSSLDGDLTWQRARQKNKELVYSGIDGQQEFSERERNAAFIPNFKWRIGYDGRMKFLKFNGELIYTAAKSNYYAISSYDEAFNVSYTYVEKRLKANYLTNAGITLSTTRYVSISLICNDLFNSRPVRQWGGLEDRDYPSLGRNFRINMNFWLD